MKKYRFVFDSVLKYKWYLLLLLILYVFAMSFSLVMPKIQGKLIDALTEKNMNGLGKYIKYLIVLFIFSVVTSFLGEVLSWFYSMKISQELMKKIIQVILRKQMCFYSKYNAGYMLQRIYEVFNLEPLYGVSLISLMMTLFSFCGALYFVWHINKTLTILCFALSPIYLFSALIYSKPIKTEEFEQQEQISLLSSRFVSYYESIFTFKMLNKSKFFLDRMKFSIDNYYNTYFKLSFLRTQYSTFSTIGSRIAPILVLIVGGKKVIDNQLTVGNLFEVMGYIGFLYQPFNKFTSFYSLFLRAKASLERVNNIINEDFERNDEERYPLNSVVNTIEYKNVSFSYSESELINDLNFKLEKGDIAAIVADSGEGKTTILNLLMEINKPNSGQIMINSKDYLSLKIKDKNSRILYLPAKPQLFEGSILENIILGDDFDKFEIDRVLKKVNLYDKIMALPNKEQTLLYDRDNICLSEGEKQRLQLARILIRNCDVLIADETTNNLDKESEKEIMEVIKKEFKHKIVVIVSHNLKEYFGINKKIILNKKSFVEN